MKFKILLWLPLLIIPVALVFLLVSPNVQTSHIEPHIRRNAGEQIKSPLPAKSSQSPDSMPNHVVDAKSHDNDSPTPLTESSHATVTGHDTIEVPLGSKVPSVLMDDGSPTDEPWVRESMADMEADFIADFESAKKSGVPVQEAWEQARERADARYTAIFGQDAFLESSSEATDEANEELAAKK